MKESVNVKLNTVSAINQLSENDYVTFSLNENSAKRVLFIGNSISKHAPKSDIGWYGDWGMAASSADKDYVHIVADALDKKYGGISYCIAQCAYWERHYFEGKELLEKLYTSARNFCADIIVVRLGENIQGEDNDKFPCKPYYDEMIKFFAKNPDAEVIVTDNFWRRDVLDKYFREVAEENEYIFCSLRGIELDESSMAIGLFEHQGVARHPGDKGMMAIAERILEKVEG